METRAPPARHLRLDDAGYRRVGTLPKNSRRGSIGLRFIVLITVRAGKANYLDAMDSGVDDFLRKPFERDRLIARVRVAMRILDLHQSLRLANTDLERRVEERTAELEKALRAKSEFLSRASHELRTPMNHILGFAQLLSLKKGLTEKQEAGVRQILESGRRLLTLIDHILGISKSDADKLSFEASGAPRLDNSQIVYVPPSRS